MPHPFASFLSAKGAVFGLPLTNITDANNHVTNFSYDAFGRVTQTAFPSGHAETYAGVHPERSAPCAPRVILRGRGNADNNLTSKTDRKSQTIQYLYDALNSGFRSPICGERS